VIARNIVVMIIIVGVAMSIDVVLIMRVCASPR